MYLTDWNLIYLSAMTHKNEIQAMLGLEITDSVVINIFNYKNYVW